MLGRGEESEKKEDHETAMRVSKNSVGAISFGVLSVHFRRSSSPVVRAVDDGVLLRREEKSSEFGHGKAS
jgi:hypothetical protein